VTGRRLAGALAPTVAVLVVSFAALLGEPPRAPAQGSCPPPSAETVTLGYVGDQVQPVGVPAGVDKVVVEVRGGHGGGEEHTGQGGQGGLVDGTIPVSPGDCLEVHVGGYGAGEGWGYGSGGDRGTQDGPGRDGTGGGGGSAIVRGGAALIVAGGGGGGGGNGAAEFDGGAGGDGAGGDGPGTPGGSDGGNGQGVPVRFFINLGGLGGGAGGTDGDGGENGYADLFAGAGGGGGGGSNGGGGAAAWQGSGYSNIERPVGGGGGGGGDSHAADAVTGVVFSVAGVDCPTGGGSADCDGQVKLSWVLEPAHVAPYAGAGQSTPITSPFPKPLEAKVTAADGSPVAGTAVEFELPSSGGYAEFADSGETTATATTDANGIATSPDFEAGDVAGNWSATATVDGVSAPARFPLRTAPATTSIALHSTASPSVSGQPISLIAVVGASPSSAGTPQGHVNFELDGVAIGDPVPVNSVGIAESEPTELAAGNHQAAARFEGTPEFTSVNAEIAQPVERGAAAVALSSSPNPSTGGAPVTFAATVAAIPPATGTPTGAVRFSVDGDPVGPDVPLDPAGNAEASFAVSEGHHLVEARYLGDGQFRAASGVLVQAAGDEITATEVSSSDPTSTYGEPVTFTAILSGPGPLAGAVTFRSLTDQEGETILCEDVEVDLVSLDGEAECVPDPPIEPGEHRIAANFSPAEQGVSPSSGQTAQHVGPAPTTSQAVATPSPITFGSPFELHTDITAPPAAGTPDGLVRFSVDGLPSGPPVAVGPLGATLPSNALPPLPGGAHSFTAAYAGSERFARSTAAGILVVDPVQTAVALETSRQDAPAGRPVTFTATVSPAGPGSDAIEGEVQFSVDGATRGDPVPVDEGVARSAPISDLARGEHDVRASFSSSGDFAPSEASLIQEIAPPVPPRVTFPCPPTRVVLADVHRHRGRMLVSGAAARGLVGRRVSIVRGQRVVGWTNVLADGTFWTRLPRPESRQGPSRYWARVAGSRSKRLVPHPRVGLVKRRPTGERRGHARVRVTVRVSGAVKRLVLGRQLQCGKASSTRLRRVRVRRHNERRVTVKLPRPGAGEPFTVYRLWTPGRRSYSPAIIVRARR